MIQSEVQFQQTIDSLMAQVRTLPNYEVRKRLTILAEIYIITVETFDGTNNDDLKRLCTLTALITGEVSTSLYESVALAMLENIPVDERNEVIESARNAITSNLNKIGVNNG